MSRESHGSHRGSTAGAGGLHSKQGRFGVPIVGAFHRQGVCLPVSRGLPVVGLEHPRAGTVIFMYEVLVEASRARAS